MAIDTSKTVTAIRIDGVNLPLATAGVTVTSSTNTGYVIVVADIGGTTITTRDSNSTVIDTYMTPTGGGSKTISVSATGTYTVTAERGGSTVWTTTVTITGIGAVCAKVPLTDYTAAEIHEACQAGIFSIMFDIKNEWKFVQTGSIFNNNIFLVEKIETINGKNIVQFRKKFPYSSTYMWDPYFTYLSSATASSFSSTYSSAGGYKYSDLRQKFMKQGDAVYIQATGIKPTGSSISTGIEFDKIYYTDGNGTTSGVYTYNPSSDTFTQDTEMTYFASQSAAQSGVKFLKGYFKSVGSGIGQATFDAGYYYTRSTVSQGYVYTRATTYNASTTYYGFYETLQEDGIFYGAFSSIQTYMVKFSDYSSTGLNQTTYLSLTEDYTDINCVEEFTGLNRTSVLKSGTSATTMYYYNIAGEGGKYPAYESIYDIFMGQDEWTRSVYSSYTTSACCLYGNGYVSYNGVYNSYRVRPGFRIA